MLSMGNGDYSTAAAFKRIRELIRLYERMGGLQQLRGKPKVVESEWRGFRRDRDRLLKGIKEDMSV